MKEKTLLRNQRVLLPLIVLAVLLCILALSSACKPVYAGATTKQLIGPGGDDGGGGGSPPTYDIQGQVFNYRTGGYAVGVTVCVYDTSNAFIGTCTTGCVGDFRIYNTAIITNDRYRVTVNGYRTDLGLRALDPRWCQWSGYVTTDSFSHGYIGNIYLDTSATVEVPAAAMYSNTKWATISYLMTGTYTFSHSLSFSVENAGINVGYSTSETAEVTYVFKNPPMLASKIVKRHYAASWYCNDINGYGYLSTTGITGFDPSWSWDLLATQEYLTTANTQVIQNHVEHRLDPGRSFAVAYTETGSLTWSRKANVPIAIAYEAFGLTINLDTQATSSLTNTVEYVLDRAGDTNPNTLTFWEYTAGAVLDIANKKGGLELHVWDVTAGGG